MERHQVHRSSLKKSQSFGFAVLILTGDDTVDDRADRHEVRKLVKKLGITLNPQRTNQSHACRGSSYTNFRNALTAFSKRL